jgi:hypothetical protein
MDKMGCLTGSNGMEVKFVDKMLGNELNVNVKTEDIENQAKGKASSPETVRRGDDEIIVSYVIENEVI